MGTRRKIGKKGEVSEVGGGASRPLTAREVAERCGVELKTVHNWAEKDLIPHFRTPGRHLRFRSVDVDEFLARHGQTPAGDNQSVLVIGSRHRAGRLEDWTFVVDPYEGLIQAGASAPAAVVLVGAGLGSVQAVPFSKGLAKRFPKAQIVWVGPQQPRGLGRAVKHAADLETARELLAG